jgi:putative nucleotidyltransferase with HDIG domain
MIKKVKIDQLLPGMFIHDFDCGWSEHPFLSDSLKVTDEKIINTIVAHGLHEVYIDTEKGIDVSDSPTKDEVNQEIQSELQKVIEPKITDRDLFPLQEEIVKAKWIIQETNKTTKKLMEDIKLGKQLEMEQVNHVVVSMVDSILRNKDALICVARMRERDEYTFTHSVNVCVLLISFSKYIGYDYKSLKSIAIGGLLHDIGKMKLPNEILNKTDKLTEDEFMKIKEHVEHGIALLDQYQNIDEIAMKIVTQHHERLDGAGYPNSLKGEEISIYGQMAAIADVYDAITSDRCYRDKIHPTDALRKLLEWSDFHFNKRLVQQFIRCIGIYPIGTVVSLESGLFGIVIKHGEKSLLHPVIRIIYDTKKGSYILRPYDIDLSQPSVNGTSDKIISHELPDKIGVRPEMYL